MPYHSGLGSSSHTDIPRGGSSVSNSDILHSSRHSNNGSK